MFGKSKTYDLDKIKKTWASLTGLEEEVFNENLEFVENQEALYHLLKLTSGLDSMVLGEEQILGQVKNSIPLFLSFMASMILSCVTRKYGAVVATNNTL